MKKILLLIISLIFLLVSPSYAFWAHQAHVSGAAGTAWSAWDEADESTLRIDFNIDGTDDTNIMFMEGSGAGDDETGRGVLTGVDLVGTETGNLAGTAGSPPYRDFDGNDDDMTVTQTYLDTLLAGSTWTMIWKVYLDGNNSDYVFSIKDSGSDDYMYIYLDATPGKLLLYLEDGNSIIENGTATANAIGTGAVRYIWVASSGTTVYWGWEPSKPTSIATMTAGNYNETLHTASLDVGFDGDKIIIGDDGDAGSNFDGRVYYFLCSSQFYF